MEQSDNIFENYKEQMQAQEHNSETLPFDKEQLWETIYCRLEEQRPRKTVLFRNLGIAAGILLIVSSAIPYLQRSGKYSEHPVTVQQHKTPASSDVQPETSLEPGPPAQQKDVASVITTPTPAKNTHRKKHILQQVPLPATIEHQKDTIAALFKDLLQDSVRPLIARLPAEPAISKTPNQVINILEGSASGVVVSNPSGQPGSAASIRIRGFSSISGNSNPLYVVDGSIYIGDIAAIDPAHIASVDILKDTAATAQYGSRASNGVVVITTKDGSYTPIQENGNLWNKLFKRKNRNKSRTK